MTNPYSFPRYYVQKNIFGLFNQWFRVFDENGSIVFFCKMRAFKLKEDFRILAADKTTELIRIKARNVIDFGATYDVLDVSTEQLLGSFRRKGLKSIFRDEWVIFDVNEQEVGVVREDSGGMAFLRRMLGGIADLFSPQQHFGSIGNQPVLAFRQTRNPFLTKTYLDFSSDGQGLLDRRMGIAAAVLFCAIEGKQE